MPGAAGSCQSLLGPLLYYTLREGRGAKEIAQGALHAEALGSSLSLYSPLSTAGSDSGALAWE